MDEILSDLGLEELIPRFRENQINPEEVINLTEQEFVYLGVVRIGDRARLRVKCKEVVSGNIASSPVVQRLLELNQQRRGRKVGHPADKTTYRFYVGWKNFTPRGFQMVTANKGGGTHHIDIEKSANMEEIIKIILEIYFPNGKNVNQNLELCDVNTTLRSFSGALLEDVVGKDTQFTAYTYYKAVITHPVRIYLHTIPKDEKSNDSDPTTDAGERLLSQVIDTASEPARNTEESLSQHVIDTASEPARNTEMSLSSHVIEPLNRDLLQFQADSGTPTIIFNTRHRLNLQRNLVPEMQTLNNNDEGNHVQRAIVLVSESDDDDSDTDLQTVLQASMASRITVEESMTDILARLRLQIIEERTNTVNVTRLVVLLGSMRAFQRPLFNPRHQLFVKFVGEDAIDEGGPTRELFRLLLNDISKMSIFTGPEEARLLDLNYSAIQAGHYTVVGRMLAYMLVHGGPSPSFFHTLLYEALVCGIDDVKPTIDDVYDDTYKEQILNIANAESNSDYASSEVLIQLAGCSAMSFDIARKDELCECLTHFVVLGRVKQCYDQLCDGLKTLGVLYEIRAHGDKLKELFCHCHTLLTASIVDTLFIPELAQDGSNRRFDEEVVLTNWRDFLLDVEGGTEPITLDGILVFATGADRAPPLGFEPRPVLRFHTTSQEQPEDMANFPFANTCANILSLPLLTDYELFKRNMASAMTMIFFTET